MDNFNELKITRMPNGRFSVQTEKTGLIGAPLDDALREVNWFLNLSNAPGVVDSAGTAEASGTVITADAKIDELMLPPAPIPITDEMAISMRHVALGYAVQGGGEAGGRSGGSFAKDVTDAASEYLRFLQTGQRSNRERT